MPNASTPYAPSAACVCTHALGSCHKAVLPKPDCTISFPHTAGTPVPCAHRQNLVLTQCNFLQKSEQQHGHLLPNTARPDAGHLLLSPVSWCFRALGTEDSWLKCLSLGLNSEGLTSHFNLFYSLRDCIALCTATTGITFSLFSYICIEAAGKPNP